MTDKINEQTQIICESCGEVFSCGAKNQSCWCFEVEIEANALENLQKNYKNCLCGNCLKNKLDLLLPGQTPIENCR